MNIEDLSLKSYFNTVFNGVIDIFSRKVAEIPPQGFNQMHIFYVPDKDPEVYIIPKQPGLYKVTLSCLGDRLWNQIVYQFAHELGHVFFLPHDQERTQKSVNWFVESCCFAMAYFCLDEMAQKWIAQPPYPNWASYAQQFVKYRENEICRALITLKIPSKYKVVEWIKAELPRLAKECKTNDRTEQLVSAIEIEQILKEHPNEWGALCYLGDSTENGKTDFDRWFELVEPEQRHLVEELASMFKA